jgi:hypothetical protein
VNPIRPASGPTAAAAPDAAPPATPAGGPPDFGGSSSKTPAASRGASRLPSRNLGARPPCRRAAEQIPGAFEKTARQARTGAGNRPFERGVERSFALYLPVIDRVGN